MNSFKKLILAGLLGAVVLGLSACATPAPPPQSKPETVSDQAPSPDAVPVTAVQRVNHATYGDCIDVAVEINSRAGKSPGSINYFPMRLIPPKSGMTHERLVERLNVYVNDAGNVIAANCG